MTYEKWVKKYKPIQNHLRVNASFEGTLFEIYDDELDFVKSCRPDNIWTYVDDGEFASIIEGYRLINRMGYFVTKKPHRDDLLEINLDNQFLDKNPLPLHGTELLGRRQAQSFCTRLQTFQKK